MNKFQQDKYDKTIEDLMLVERQVNELLSDYYGRKYEIRKEKIKYLKSLGVGMVYNFLVEKIHRETRKEAVLKLFFHAHTVDEEAFIDTCIKNFEMYRSNDKNYSYLCNAFVNNSGLQVAVEGGTKNRYTKNRYIERQIEILNQRKHLVG